MRISVIAGNGQSGQGNHLHGELLGAGGQAAEIADVADQAKMALSCESAYSSQG